ncbi:MAG TPA: ATP-dependent protease, partial [Eubacteriaceae bacterium]|nr:ATP-dependent protease [Eubacteriaceae bacterium]
FNDPDKPLAVGFRAGAARSFQEDMQAMLENLKTSIAKAFENSEYKQQRDQISNSVRQQMVDLFHKVETKAKEAGFVMQQYPGRVIFVPAEDGEPMPKEAYEKLSLEERKEIEQQSHDLEKQMDEAVKQGQRMEREGSEKIAELDRKIAFDASEEIVGKVKEKYQEVEKLEFYLDALLKDVVDNYRLFVKNPNAQGNPFQQGGQGGGQGDGGGGFPGAFLPQNGGDRFNRYKANLFVTNESEKGAPVIVESNPNFYNLFGKIEYKSSYMNMTTDFTMIKSGALHRANGGYLILHAKDLLMDPLVWNSLKKALKYQEAVIENIGEQYRLIPTKTFRPQAIPLDVKVVLIGTPIFYEVFSSDEDFVKLFKIKVDFDVEMPRNKDNVCQYVSFVSSICEEEKLKAFDRSALAAIIEYGSMLSADQNKLSTRFSDIKDIVLESHAMAKMKEAELVTDGHVKQAIEQRKYRVNKIEEKMKEQIHKNRISIQTEGEEIGQVNGLSVMMLSGYMFGIPSRITAQTYMGKGGVINIERETNMSGSIHTKGVLTLSGYLGGKFAKEKPLSLTAQITFEQNYGGVDGDSASSTELYAVLSSIGRIPLKQNIAVTGSVDQRGMIQPVGGVTQKIEGFFDVCREKGLTGDQGVMIPHQNVENLMLKEEVLEAVEEGRFHIYAVKTIEEGIEILTGLPAGEQDEEGEYPEGSVFAKVKERLEVSHKKLRESRRPLKATENNKEEAEDSDDSQETDKDDQNSDE